MTIEKMKAVFANISPEKKALCEDLIQNAVFMSIELGKLQTFIAENGCTETYQNGANQWGKKKSSEVEVYNAMIKNYTAVIKQLVDLVPEDVKADELMDFIK